MDWGRVKFFLGEVLRNFTRNAGMQATAIGTVAITIILLGAFLFVREAITGLGNQVLSGVEFSVYFDKSASSQDEDQLRNAISKDARVASFEFVSKKQGLEEFRAATRGVIDTSTLTENPLPDKMRIRVHDPAVIPTLAVELKKLSGVNDVVYQQEVIERLLQLGSVLHRVGIVLIAVFLIVAGIIISNTIRLTVFARRREISIMQLVGATNMYIRAPFICEGLLDGVVGALIAVILLVGARYFLWPKLLLALPWVQLGVTQINGPLLIAELLAVGGAIGVVSSWISVGRHLRT